jgi:nickel transport protein
VRPHLVLAFLALALPAVPRAHAVSGEVERRGSAFAVRARYEGGKPLAGAAYQVLRPGRPERVQGEGRTDAQGWVEFVPDVPGAWRVRIVDASGHGRVVTVEVADAASAPEPSVAPVAVPPASAAVARPFPVLRTAAGALAIAIAFSTLRAVQRRRRGGR